MEYYWSVPTFK